MKKHTVATMAIAASMLFASTVAAGTHKEVEAFKKGFYRGISSIKKEIRDQGYESKQLALKPYIVKLDIDKLSTTDIMYIKHLGTREGLDPVITEHQLIMGDYSREADALYVKKEFKKTYNIDFEVLRLKDGTKYYSFPLVFKDIYELMEDDIKTKNKVIVITRYVEKDSGKEIDNNNNRCRATGKKTSLKPAKDYANKHRHKKIKYFTLKHSRVQSYKYDYCADKNPGAGGKKWREDLFSEYKIIKKTKRNYPLGRVLVTDEGGKYVKARNINLFFDANDVKILGK